MSEDKQNLNWVEQLAVSLKVKAMYRDGYLGKFVDYLLMWVEDAFRDKKTKDIYWIIRLVLVDAIVKIDRKIEALGGHNRRDVAQTKVTPRGTSKGRAVGGQKKGRKARRRKDSRDKTKT